jgi:indolepyruvate ferredoxin oxidoreductase
VTELQVPKKSGYELLSKYNQEEGRVYLTGLQALVRAPLDQMRADRRNGLRTRGFISGYPGSPLAGLDLELGNRAALLQEHGIVHKPGLNEELGATAVMGSQIAMRFGSPRQQGVVGVWYGKAPGLDRAADAIRHANYFGTTRHGGVLAYVGDDPSCKSSSVPSSSEALLADLSLPVLHPGTVQEILDFGAHGIAMSRASGLWTAVKVVTQIADGGGTALVSPDRVVPVLPEDAAGRTLGKDEPATLSPPQIIAVERDMHENRMPAALRYGQLNGLNEITVSSGDDWIGIIAPGHLYYETVTALQRLGLEEEDLERRGVRLLRLGMVHPLDIDLVRAFAGGVREVIVVEDKRSRLELLVKDALYGLPRAPMVLGKTRPDGTPLLPAYGAIDADALVRPLRDRLAQVLPESEMRVPAELVTRPLLPMLPRTPYFCSGCPHNTSLRVPEGGMVGAGIGCHSMVAFMAPEFAGEVTGVTQMGGEGAQWIGASDFVETDHLFQNLGEGTFFHSGEMAVRASVAAGTHVTYKILYNRAVAMTGGQDAVGALGVPDMAKMLMTVGVKKVIITAEDRSRYRGVKLPKGVELRDREDIIEAQEVLAKIEGVTALIHDQQCAAEARRLRKRGKQVEPPERVLINERVCEGCGDCGAKSNCLSVRPTETEYGPKTVIDQSSCNKDYSCLKGDCPSFITLEPRKGAAKHKEATAPAIADSTTGPDWEAALAGLPEPVLVVDPDNTSVRMPGVGGSGVVTVAQVVGTAALLDGKYVSGLDQTGLAQKGGAVVSDLHLTSKPSQTSAKVPAGAVDLMLAFDLVVALSPANVSGLSPSSVVVASTAVAPTGAQIGTGKKQPAVEQMVAQLQARSRDDASVYVDMADIVQRLFGSSQGANIFGLGVAFQSGALPISATSLERAIELNGVAVQANQRAFNAGRLYVADRALFDELLAAASSMTQAEPAENARSTAGGLAALGGVSLGGEVGRIVADRAVDLVGYQNEKLAKAYLAEIEAVVRVEESVKPGSTALAEAAARYLYKLMAYKDEYEVPRLHLDDAASRQVAEVARGGEVRAVWHLHPPMLRAMGMKKKLRFGPWARPMFAVLASMKFVRGTPLDVFGYALVRKVERRLVADYRAWLAGLPGELTPANYDTALQLAILPDIVRGYEEIKLANVETYDARRAELLQQMREHR